MAVEADSEVGRLPVLSRLLWRILDRSKRVDYLVVAALAALPLLHAWLIGAHETIGSYRGY